MPIQKVLSRSPSSMQFSQQDLVKKEKNATDQKVDYCALRILQLTQSMNFRSAAATPIPGPTSPISRSKSTGSIPAESSGKYDNFTELEEFISDDEEELPYGCTLDIDGNLKPKPGFVIENDNRGFSEILPDRLSEDENAVLEDGYWIPIHSTNEIKD